MNVYEPTLKVYPIDGGLEIKEKFALFVGACGYEARSRFVFESLAEAALVSVVLDYDGFKGMAYSANYLAFAAVESVNLCSGDNFAALIAERIDRMWVDPGLAREYFDELGRMRVVVDVSSMDRDKIAEVMLAVIGNNARRQVSVSCVYAPGIYTLGMNGSEGTILVNRPVQGLEGWSSSLDLPLQCVMGLGFESDLALASLETLEPSDTIAFSAIGLDSRYDAELAKKNAYLLSSTAGTGVKYRLDQPFQTFLLLQSVVGSLLAENRVVIVPLGPKIFALVSVVVAIGFGDGVSVWRVSADAARVPEDREAAGSIVGLRIVTDEGAS